MLLRRFEGKLLIASWFFHVFNQSSNGKMVRNAGNIICVYGDSYKEKKVSFEFSTRIRKEIDQKTSSE